ncbi:acyltransferase family protein [Micromonospora sp. NPDC049275]|uniref:acyltransferase family protein n=1 Tax=Micromonospora sp. NPDC049275 TaxID=3364268 RepID=UPI003715162B
MTATLSRLPSLTGVRFVAAMLVFLGHIGNSQIFSDSSAQHTFDRLFFQGGWTAVDFFFIASGFGLTWAARPDDTARTFWRRRFFRIYPNYVVAFLFAVLVGHLVLLYYRSTTMRIWDGLINLLMLQAWSPDQRIEFGVNTIAWSLSAEAFFYLCFPFLIRLARRVPGGALWPAAVALMGAVWLVPLVGRLVVPDQPHSMVGPVSAPQYWFVYIFPATRLLEFALGIAMARIVQTERWPRLLGVLPVLVLLAVAYVVPDVTGLPWSYRQVAVTVIPVALLIPALAMLDLKERWSPLRGRAMVWLGTCSYAFFLLHGRIMESLQNWLGGGPWSTHVAIAMAVFILVVAVAAAGLLYTYVENPIRKRWSKPRPRQSAPAVAARELVPEPGM